MTPEAIALSLGGAKQVGPVTWRCDCPACGYPTLEVYTNDNGALGARCFKCWNDGTPSAPYQQLKARGLIRGLSRREIARARVEARAEAERVWADSVPVETTEAATYLTSRGLHPPYPDTLRAESHGQLYDGHLLVAWKLLCLVEHAASGMLGVHAINLCSGGRVKRPGSKTYQRFGGVFDGGGVWFGTPNGELVVGEGLETTLSALVILGRTWGVAALGARGMKRLELPDSAEAVVIATDNDEPGQDASKEAQERWLDEGRAVRVVIPNQPGTDFNDLLRGRNCP